MLCLQIIRERYTKASGFDKGLYGLGQAEFVLGKINRQDAKGAKEDAKEEIFLCRVTAKGKA